jgi:hypothetical protein
MNPLTDEIARATPSPHGFRILADAVEQMANGAGLPIRATAVRNAARELENLPARIELALDAVWRNRDKSREDALLAGLRELEAD